MNQIDLLHLAGVFQSLALSLISGIVIRFVVTVATTFPKSPTKLNQHRH